MEIIKYEHYNSNKLPNIINEIIPNNNFVIFDIETTGLNPTYNKVILIGLLYIKNKDIIVIEQLFCNNSKKESKLLETFKNKIKNFDYYITFNGGNFDIPFLNKRLIKNNINFSIDPFYNIDLYKIVKKNKNILNLENCKLKTIEKFLGINREDTISGSDSVILYRKYEKTLNKDLKKKILLHNYEDIRYLLPTLNILNFIDKNNILPFIPFEIVYNNSLKIQIINCKIKKDFLIISGKFKGNINQDYIYYDHTLAFELLKENNEFHLKIPILNIKLSNNDSISFINIDELSFINNTLSTLEANERNKYIIKVQKNIIYSNLYNFIKDFIILFLNKFSI